MARKRATTGRKAPNGQGDSLNVLFDRSDPKQKRALDMARLLASVHGRRKDAIVALLDAMYSIYENTGELLYAEDIYLRLTQPNGGTSGGNMGFQQAVARGHGLPTNAAQGGLTGLTHAEPRQRPPAAIQVTSAKTSAETIGNNFRSSAGAAFFD
jgi:hypothetical protein